MMTTSVTLPFQHNQETPMKGHRTLDPVPSSLHCTAQKDSVSPLIHDRFTKIDFFIQTVNLCYKTQEGNRPPRGPPQPGLLSGSSTLEVGSMFHHVLQQWFSVSRVTLPQCPT